MWKGVEVTHLHRPEKQSHDQDIIIQHGLGTHIAHVRIVWGVIIEGTGMEVV